MHAAAAAANHKCYFLLCMAVQALLVLVGLQATNALLVI